MLLVMMAEEDRGGGEEEDAVDVDVDVDDDESGEVREGETLGLLVLFDDCISECSIESITIMSPPLLLLMLMLSFSL